MFTNSFPLKWGIYIRIFHCWLFLILILLGSYAVAHLLLLILQHFYSVSCLLVVVNNCLCLFAFIVVLNVIVIGSWMLLLPRVLYCYFQVKANRVARWHARLNLPGLLLRYYCGFGCCCFDFFLFYKRNQTIFIWIQCQFWTKIVSDQIKPNLIVSLSQL